MKDDVIVVDDDDDLFENSLECWRRGCNVLKCDLRFVPATAIVVSVSVAYRRWHMMAHPSTEFQSSAAPHQR